MNKERGMSRIVKTVTCILSIPITIFGLYIILHGHLTPGGGFAGGAIIATLVALFLISFGSVKLPEKSLSVLESLGLVAFIILAFIGLSTSFFHNFLANSNGLFGSSVSFGSNSGFLNTGGIIPLMNLAVGLEVFSALSLILLLMFKGDIND